MLTTMFDVSPWILWPLASLLALVLLLFVAAKIPFSYIAGNLMVRWRTTLMTALAFTLVVTVLTMMLAFVNGMYALTQSSGYNDNVIILSEGATDEGFSNLGYSEVGDLENQPGILRQDGAPLLSRETYLVVSQPIPDPPAGRSNKRFLQLRGIDDVAKAAAVHRIELIEGGEWFSSAGVRELEGSEGGTAIEVVVGEGIAREMGLDRHPEARAAARNPQRLDVGDTFSLNNRTWIITGVMKSSGSTFDSEVWAKQSLIGPIFAKDNVTTLVARTPSPEDAIRFRDFLNKEYSAAAITAQVETDYFAQLSEMNNQFLYAIAFVTVFMAVGGMFGVMNTMYAAISQRIKDIGVLRLMGFGRLHILATFLLESLTIALVGGIIGCVAGLGFDGWTANSIVSGGPGGGKFVVLKLIVDAQILSVGMLLALAIGLVGGLLPSLRAMRMTALETLR